jgi:hypothetical protein
MSSSTTSVRGWQMHRAATTGAVRRRTTKDETTRWFVSLPCSNRLRNGDASSPERSPEEEINLLRAHDRTGRPLGDEAFLLGLEKRLGRILRRQKPGPKPKKQKRPVSAKPKSRDALAHRHRIGEIHSRHRQRDSIPAVRRNPRDVRAGRQTERCCSLRSNREGPKALSARALVFECRIPSGREIDDEGTGQSRSIGRSEPRIHISKAAAFFENGGSPANSVWCPQNTRRGVRPDRWAGAFSGDAPARFIAPLIDSSVAGRAVAGRGTHQ